MTIFSLLSRSGLAANAVVGQPCLGRRTRQAVRVLGVAGLRHRRHRLKHLPRRLGREHPPTGILRNFAINLAIGTHFLLDESRPAEHATIRHRGHCGDHLHRRRRNALTKANVAELHQRPLVGLGELAVALADDPQIDAPAKTKSSQVVVVVFAVDAHGDLAVGDVARHLQRLLAGHLPVRVVVFDHLAGQGKSGAGGDDLVERHFLFLDANRQVKDLERRARLVLILERRVVPAVLGRILAVVGVQRRRGGKRKNFAGFYVEHRRNAKSCAEFLHRGVEVMLGNSLNLLVDRQHQRLAAIDRRLRRTVEVHRRGRRVFVRPHLDLLALQQPVKARFDASRLARSANQRPREHIVGVKPLKFALKRHALGQLALVQRNAHGLGLGVANVLGQVHKAGVAVDALTQLFCGLVEQFAQRGRYLRAVCLGVRRVKGPVVFRLLAAGQQPARIDRHRVGAQRGGQRHTVAVDEIAAAGLDAGAQHHIAFCVLAHAVDVDDHHHCGAIGDDDVQAHQDRHGFQAAIGPQRARRRAIAGPVDQVKDLGLQVLDRALHGLAAPACCAAQSGLAAPTDRGIPGQFGALLETFVGLVKAAIRF